MDYLEKDIKAKLQKSDRINHVDDPYFRTQIDRNSSSPDPETGIWFAQHVCVSPDFALNAKLPKNPGKAVIDVEFNRKHWSVLRFGFFCVHYGGYPHDAVMQLTRNSGCHLVQSYRYTGDHLVEEIEFEDLLEKYRDDIEAYDTIPLEVINHEDILCLAERRYSKQTMEKYFYYQPEGRYATRDGSYYIYERHREMYFRSCYESCIEYATLYKQGVPSEVCRRSLKAGYRQNGVLAGTFQQLFHILDQRTLQDSQLEVRTLAKNIMEQVRIIAPQFIEYYEKTRFGKAILTP
jgi:thymidylate synthase ThyX